MHITRAILILIVTYFFSGLALAARHGHHSVGTETNDSRPVQVNARDVQKAVPKVVVSIPPFYALVSEIMQGVGEPELLLSSGASSHHAVLSPKHIQSLEQADIIFWGGPDLETFLIRPLKNIDLKKTQLVELDTTPGLRFLKTRFSPNFNDEAEEAAHDHDHGHDTAHHDEKTTGHARHHGHSHADHIISAEHSHVHSIRDMHFWLDPYNGLLLVDRITQVLTEAYPMGRLTFEKNSAQLKKNIKALDKNLKSQLASIKNKPYLVLHDGYQYFEHRYGLKAVGAITHHPELPISVARMQKIREIIIKEKVECIFGEPATPAKLTETLAKEFHLRSGILDPMERPDKKGVYRYENLFIGLSSSLLSCLAPKTE